MTAGSKNGGAVTRDERLVLWGPLTFLGFWVALATAVIDQASKLWLIYGFLLGDRGRVTVTPFLDLALQWNKGISYGLFPQEGRVGYWALLALMVIACVLLWIWLAKVSSRLTAVSLGLIIGGAIGNAIDRLVHPGVADFVLLHAFGVEWYIFNVADVAIVLGVVGLLYETLIGVGAAKAP
jgi:signal peptidase II